MNKVLIVDDSSTLRRITMRVLRQADIPIETVVEASNGIEALEQLRAHPDIGLILADVSMPRMDGVDFVKALRATHAKEALPVIMLSTEGGQALTDSALEQGANGFVCKPFTPDSIRGALGPDLV